MTVKKINNEIKMLKGGYQVYIDAANMATEEGNYYEADNFLNEAKIIIFNIRKLEDTKIEK